MVRLQPPPLGARGLIFRAAPAPRTRGLRGQLLGLLLLAGSTCALVAGCGGQSSSAGDTLHSSAQAFLTHYVAADGAVIRRGQGGDVVSEGQAYGMLIAELAGADGEVRRIWDWTKDHLLQPNGLLAYHATAQGVLLSHQSATDADTLAAYALLRYRGPNAQQLHLAGLRLAAAVIRGESVKGAGGTFLPTAGPWALGIPTIVDPSYWMPSVYLSLARYTGDSSWKQAAGEAITLTSQVTAGGRLLPPDWAELTGSSIRAIPGPSGGAPIQYGLDAARVPIFMAASCSASGRSLARSWWSHFFRSSAARVRSIALTTTGKVLNSETNPLPYLAAAAAAKAAGDNSAAERLIGEARAEGRRYPTYYGEAWLVLGPALLTGRLGGCAPG